MGFLHLRYKTRITLAVSGLTVFSIFIMSGLLLALAGVAVGTHFVREGSIMNRFAKGEVEHALGLTGEIADCISDQLVLSAFITAEFAAVAENDAGLSPEEISDRLRRVIGKARAYRDKPLVDEFWITDESGVARIHTQDFDFVFRESGEGESQSSAFLPLLESGAAPVAQPLQPRDHDGKEFMYVGVPGVDKPRIVQLGVSEALLDSIRSRLDLDDILARFVRDGNVLRCFLVDTAGRTVARAGTPEIDEGVRLFVTRFLTQGAEGIYTQSPTDRIGVAVKVSGPPGEAPLGLYMEYSTRGMVAMLRQGIFAVLGIGAILTVIAVMLSVFMSNRLIRPLRQLTKSVRLFGAGDLAHRAEVPEDRDFSELASSFNTMAGSILSYTQEIERQTIQRERLESELRISAELQRAVLPVAPPEMAGIEMSGFSLPAREVGGDFYDYHDLGSGRMGVVIGDATGKGLPAALLISQCSSYIRALADRVDSPAELLRRTNGVLCQRLGDTGRFVTLFYMIIDVRERVLRYSVAGHNPPLLFRNGTAPLEVLRLRSKRGLPLGVMPDCDFEDGILPMYENDLVILYSDGVTEATSAEGSFYGERRFEEQLRERSGESLDAVLAAIRSDVQAHAGDGEAADDMTLVGVRFTGQGNRT